MKKFVIIGGMYRSGTTLAETIIGSHSNISIPPRDFPFVERYMKLKSIKGVFTNFQNLEIWKRWGEELDRWGVKNKSQLLNLDQFLQSSPAEVYKALLVGYAKLINKSIPGVKSPLNEFYYDIISKWLRDFDLKFIHLVRNPFDVIASYQNSPYVRNEFKRNFRNIYVHTKNWYRSVSLGLARSNFNPDGYFLLKYEDLTAEPLKMIHKLCEFFQVELQAGHMLNRKDYIYYTSNSSFEKSSDEKTKQFIQPSKSRKHYLDKTQIQIIGSTCGELARAIGYDDEDFCAAIPEALLPVDLYFKRKIKGIARKLFTVQIYRKLAG